MKRITQNAIKEVSKGECIIMGDFNHGHIQWKSLESTGGDDQQFLFLIQESFLTQHVLEPTRGENVLDIVLSSQKELVDIIRRKTTAQHFLLNMTDDYGFSSDLPLETHQEGSVPGPVSRRGPT